MADCGRLCVPFCFATVCDDVIVQVADTFWPTVGDRGRLWATMDDYGQLWPTVADCGRFWPTLCFATVTNGLIVQVTDTLLADRG